MIDGNAVILGPKGQRVDLLGGIVSGPAGEILLEARLACLLRTLADAKGAVVSRGALIERVWQGRPVGDDAIDSAICRLRIALGDKTRTLIQTVPKRGYRLRDEQPQGNVAALCARGEIALALWEPASARAALSSFEAALKGAMTPRALAGAALSRARLRLAGARLGSEDIALSMEQARRACAAAPELGLSWLSLGAVRFLSERDASGALSAIDQAIAREPESALAWMWRSQVDLAAGRLDCAVDAATHAVTLDTDNVAMRASRIATFFIARRYAACVEAADSDAAEGGASIGALAYKGWALMMSGECERAVEVMAASWRASPGRTEKLGTLRAAFASGGKSAYFSTLARLTSSDVPDDVVRPVDRAALWAMAGETGQALAALRLAEDRDDIHLKWIAVLPQLESLRGLEEFREMCDMHASRVA